MYISVNGVEDINMLRVGFKAVPVGRPPIEMLGALPSEDCGCPEEVWNIDGIIYVVHFEADGSGELTAFVGEDDPDQSVFEVRSMNHLRVKMFEFHANLEVEE